MGVMCYLVCVYSLILIFVMTFVVFLMNYLSIKFIVLFTLSCFDLIWLKVGLLGNRHA